MTDRMVAPAQYVAVACVQTQKIQAQSLLHCQNCTVKAITIHLWVICIVYMKGEVYTVGEVHDHG